MQNSRETDVRDVAQLFAKEVFCELDIPPRRTWVRRQCNEINLIHSAILPLTYRVQGEDGRMREN